MLKTQLSGFVVNFHYTVIPFGKKKKKFGATYQEAMTTIFDDILHDCLEDYVVDIVAKSKEVHNHVSDISKVF